MSHPNPQHDRENEYRFDGVAERIMAKIVPAIPQPALKCNMFAGRNKKYPV